MTSVPRKGNPSSKEYRAVVGVWVGGHHQTGHHAGPYLKKLGLLNNLLVLSVLGVGLCVCLASFGFRLVSFQIVKAQVLCANDRPEAALLSLA